MPPAVPTDPPPRSEAAARAGSAPAWPPSPAVLWPGLPRAEAAGPGDDPLFASQWHLFNAAPGEFDLNVVPVWAEYSGAGVRVAVIDDGIDAAHVDLAPGYLAAAAFDLSTGTAGAAPVHAANGHGTAVAGIIGAADNDLGVIGVAHGAALFGLRVDFDGSSTGAMLEAQILDGLLRVAGLAGGGAQAADVANMSFGYPDPYAVAGVPLPQTQTAAAAAAAVAQGRGGLGTILVKSSGNGRMDGSDTAFEMLDSHPGVITVAAVGRDGSVTFYSTPGAGVLVSAFGSGVPGEIVTTDRSGAEGYDAGDYFDGFNGTSAAAPMVSGVAALMLEANPGLGWRDVQTILALSARHVGSAIGAAPAGDEAAPWQVNAATFWNGGGLRFSPDYGFGLVDARAAVRLAEMWGALGPAATSATLASDGAVLIAAPETLDGLVAGGVQAGTGGSESYGAALAADLLVERVAVTLTLAAPAMGELRITVTSPGGTSTSLIVGDAGATAVDADWTWTTNALRGERSAGTWTVTLTDTATGNPIVVSRADLTVTGSPAGASTHSVLTDEWSDLAALPGRSTALVGTGAADTLNAAAVLGDSRVDLAAGTARVDGVAMTVAGYERVFTGDGDDVLVAGAAAALLDAGRGVDMLTGGAGNDTLRGGAGDDFMNGRGGTDLMLGGDGDDLMILAEGEGPDSIDGGAGIDTLILSTNSVVAIDLAAGHYSMGGGALADMLGIEVVMAGAGADVIAGSAADESLQGGQGDDALDGRGGNDTLEGDDGADTLRGGAGDDLVAGGAGDDLVILAPGEHAAGDQIDGGTGDDRLRVLATGGVLDLRAAVVAGIEAFEVHTDPGTAFRLVLAAAQAFGAAGAAPLFARGAGPGGTVTVELADPAAGMTDYSLARFADWAAGDSLVLHGTAAAETVRGTDAADRLIGGGGLDTLDGGAGDDTLQAAGLGHAFRGGTGHDTVALDAGAAALVATLGAAGHYRAAAGGPQFALEAESLLLAGTGAAAVTGDAGANLVQGAGGRDTLSGDAGDDTLSGGAGDDLLSGGTGADFLRGEDGRDTLRGDEGADTLGGGADADLLVGWSGDDWLYGGAGDDTLTGGAGDDRMFGGDGVDMADYSGAGGGVTVRLWWTGWQAIGAGQGFDQIQQVEAVRGSAHADTLAGSAGDDWLFGGAGADILTPGAGNDRLFGGDGLDTADYSGVGGGVTVRLWWTGWQAIGAGQGFDQIQQVEAVRGSAFGDVLAGSAGADRLEGGEGADTLEGGGGADTLDGGAGADRLDGGGDNDFIRGEAGDDLLWGGAGADTLGGADGQDALDGGAGDDWLYGGAGADTLAGGAGADRQWGGDGADTFRFLATGDSTLAARDRIEDFPPGLDRIDLSAIDADTAAAGRQAFAFLGTAGFTGAAQLRFVSNGVDGWLLGTDDALPDAEFNLHLIGVTALAAADLIL
jgi:Ca2+-binding RTX toxin-like protein/subtilisin family serine protease